MLTLFSCPGERGDHNDREVIDLVREDEEEDSEDEDSEDEDEVTETEVAKSEQGKQPVFHHEIYNRLVNLASRQGTYSTFLPTLLLQKMY